MQRAFPEAHVVETLTTLTAALMVHPQSLGASSTVFVSGDDAAAKATVIGILASFGHDDVVDLGDIETARGTEMVLPIRLRLMGALGTAKFNLEVVRWPRLTADLPPAGGERSAVSRVRGRPWPRSRR